MSCRLALFLPPATAAAPLSANDHKAVFHNLKTDAAWTAGMALGQATKALEAGYKVVIFLNVHALFLASRSFKTESKGLVNKGVQDMLNEALNKGAQAIICRHAWQRTA